MGICSGSVKSVSLAEDIYRSACSAIEQNEPTVLSKLISTHFNVKSSFNIDLPLVSLNGTKMSFLAYSLIIGSSASTVLLLEKTMASIALLHSQLAKLGVSALDIICNRGDLKVLKSYLPLYLKRTAALNSTQEHTPIQQAAIKGNTNLIKYIYTQFKHKDPPRDLDLHYISEVNGENTALCSLRSGKLSLVKFLFRICHANFHLLNKRKENAVLIAAVFSKKQENVSFLEVLKYLMETVKVDFTYAYEEALLVADDPEIIEFYEGKLREKGILVSKNSIDRAYAVPYNKPIENYDCELNLVEMLKHDVSHLSSIPRASWSVDNQSLYNMAQFNVFETENNLVGQNTDDHDNQTQHKTESNENKAVLIRKKMNTNQNKVNLPLAQKNLIRNNTALTINTNNEHNKISIKRLGVHPSASALKKTNKANTITPRRN